MAVKLVGGAVVAILLAGCGSMALKSDKIDYRKVSPQKPLDVPPELSQLPRDDRFAVPGGATATATATAAAARPAQPGGAQVAPSAPNARVEREGTQRWLAVDVPPEQAFATLKAFWPSIGLTIEREDAALGIVETVWAENRAKLPQDFIRRTIGRIADGLYSTGEQDKYRSRVERTAKNTAEIFISHRGMQEVFTTPTNDSTAWQPRPSDPQLEAEMLQRLLLQFARAGDAAATLAAATTVAAAVPKAASAPQIARVVPASGAEAAHVQIDEPFDRAWRRVGLALDRGGFTVEDRDRTKGLYFVRYLDPEYEAKQREQQGVFSRVFGREQKIDAQQFRVQVAAAGAATQVVVLDKDGKAEASATGSKILGQINEQLR